MTPAERIEKIGRALHGARWINLLAVDLGINPATIRRWISGRTPLPENHGVFLDAANVIARRIDLLTKAAALTSPGQRDL